MIRSTLASVGTRALRGLSEVGHAGALAAKVFRQGLRRPLHVELCLRECEQIGLRSFSLVALIALFTGMVLALQTGYGLGRFGAKLYVGTLVSMALVRELGPVLTAVTVGGRIASGIAAEIGSMLVTEQIDAMRALGANPIKKLVAPKVFAGMISLPLLTVFADVIGIVGGMIVAQTELNIGARFYLHTVWESVTIGDLMSGLAKTVIFGLIISLMGCHFGLRASRSTVGVGQATTAAVVASSVLIMLSDTVLTKLMLLL